jgi:CubicO group peptidase (beta-lactamase class C family)
MNRRFLRLMLLAASAPLAASVLPAGAAAQITVTTEAVADAAPGSVHRLGEGELRALVFQLAEPAHCWEAERRLVQLYRNGQRDDIFALIDDYDDLHGDDADAMLRMHEMLREASHPTLRFHASVRRELDAAQAGLASLEGLLAGGEVSALSAQLREELQKRAARLRAAVQRLERELSDDARYHQTYKQLGMKVSSVLSLGGQPVSIGGKSVQVAVEHEWTDRAAPSALESRTDAQLLAGLIDSRVRLSTLEPGGFVGAVLVAQRGEILLSRSYGMADETARSMITPDSLFDWASIGKQFTAAAVLTLVMDGRLSLDDPLTTYFPDAPTDKREITVRHLLHHTSGMALERPGDSLPFETLEDREKMVDFILGGPMHGPPGASYAYDNLGYTLAAAIVEQVAGMSFDQYCVERLFRPAGMAASLIGREDLVVERVPRDRRGAGVRFAYGPKLHWGYRGAGGVVCSTADLLKWDRALRDSRVLSPEALALYYTPPGGVDDGMGYAMGWQVFRKHGEPYLMHSGAVGDSASVYLRTEQSEIVVAVACTFVPELPLHNLALELSNLVLEWN